MLADISATRVRDPRVVDEQRYRREQLAQGVANRMVNVDTGSLASKLDRATSAKLIAENPIKMLKPLPTSERRVPRASSEEEVERLLAAEAEDAAKCTVRLAATRTIDLHRCGARHAARMRPERVPQAPLWRALTLRVATSKARRSRVIPAPQSLVDGLLARRPVHQRVRMRLAQPSDRILLSQMARTGPRTRRTAGSCCGVLSIGPA